MNITAPTTDQIKAARHAAQLSQSEAAALVHLGSSQRWAEYEQGKRNIDTARFELFLIKTDQSRDYIKKTACGPRVPVATREKTS